MTRVSLKGMTRRVPTMGGGAAPSTLLDGLVAYWTMNEAAGSNRADSVGSSTAVLNGTVGSVAGKIGNAARFNSNVANYLSVTDNPTINTSGISYTVAFWFKFNGTGLQGILGKNTGGAIREFLVDWDGSNVRMWVYGGAGFSIASAPISSPNTSTWYAFRGWYDYAANKVWSQVDDGAAGSANGPTGGSNVGDSLLRFGVWDGLNRPGNCDLDGVGFWRRVLTDAEWIEFRAGKEYPF